eukprot:571574-Amphidinium_carterae.1
MSAFLAEDAEGPAVRSTRSVQLRTPAHSRRLEPQDRLQWITRPNATSTTCRRLELAPVEFRNPFSQATEFTFQLDCHRL